MVHDWWPFYGIYCKIFLEYSYFINGYYLLRSHWTIVTKWINLAKVRSCRDAKLINLRETSIFFALKVLSQKSFWAYSSFTFSCYWVTNSVFPKLIALMSKEICWMISFLEDQVTLKCYLCPSVVEFTSELSAPIEVLFTFKSDPSFVFKRDESAFNFIVLLHICIWNEWWD